MQRPVFFISDSTGITAETLGHSLLAQFPQIQFEEITIPYVNSVAKAEEVIVQINHKSHESENRPLVFSTLAKPEIRAIFSACNCIFLDFFDILIGPLEKELQSKYAQDVGKLHNIKNVNSYDQRISAIDFTLNTDDGVGLKHYDAAEVILIGVSRSGKTPVCLYLALKFGIFAANYPLTEEDLTDRELPHVLIPYKSKLFGLVITPERLQQIRQQRLPNSKYASLDQCQKELKIVRQMFVNTDLPFLETTTFSIEEIAAKIIQQKKIKRHLF